MSIRGLGCGGFPASGPIGRLLTMTVGPSIGDVVAYSSSSSSRPLLLGVINEAGKVQELLRRTGDDNDSLTFHENESEDPLDIKNVTIAHVFDEDEAYITQRIVDDRVSNPHGEHAEDVYVLKLNDLKLAIDYTFDDFIDSGEDGDVVDET